MSNQPVDPLSECHFSEEPLRHNYKGASSPWGRTTHNCPGTIFVCGSRSYTGGTKSHLCAGVGEEEKINCVCVRAGGKAESRTEQEVKFEAEQETERSSLLTRTSSNGTPVNKSPRGE